MTPRSFHLAAAIVLGLGTLGVAYSGLWLGSVVLGLGALVALLHWRAAKAGLID